MAKKRDRNFLLTWFALLLLAFWWESIPAYGFVHCKNKTFVNEQGKEVFLKGIGLGGWLVPEGYMLHFPGFGSPTSINAQVVDVIGEQNAQLFWKTYRANYVNEQDIARLAELGYNSIRLPFNYRLLSPQDQPGVYLEDGFALLDQFIQWCAQYRLYVILDMHCAPGGQNAGNISDSDGEVARLWTDTTNQSRTVDIWKTIAARYANDTTVIGYDLLNEPVLPQGHSATELRNLYMRITNAIRQVDSNHIIFVEGNWYATDFTALTPPWDANMAYSFHKYWNEPTQASIQSYLNMRQTYGVPLWMGESGENSNHWFARTVRLLQENNIGWAWWTHKKFETTTSPYSAKLPDDFQTLVNYWNGQGSKPSQAFALSVLMRFAENLKLDKCTFLPDVVDALFNTQFFTQSKPFAANEIPGTIACVNYDLGANGVAYSDADYERTQFDSYTPWNQGGQYRNDGVDIEKSNDAQGSEFSVGWIEAGEWLNFSVQIASAGTYEAQLRVASLNGGGQLQLKCDGGLLTTITVPKTGGWYNWTTLTVPDLSLPQGNHSLQLSFLSGGFNINQIEFVKVNGMGSANEPPQTFELGQNYPNPFNQSTRIPYVLTRPGTVQLDIFDLAGHRLFTARQNSSGGAGFFLWDGHDSAKNAVSSGVYFYRVQSAGARVTKKMVCLR